MVDEDILYLFVLEFVSRNRVNPNAFHRILLKRVRDRPGCCLIHTRTYIGLARRCRNKDNKEQIFDVRFDPPNRQTLV